MATQTATATDKKKTAASPKQPPRTLNLILGGKGGTGKTLFARLLYYALTNAGIKAVGLDSDIENPEFLDFHADQSQGSVVGLDFMNVAKSKTIISMLMGTFKNEAMPHLTAMMPLDAIVVDMPAASGHDCREQLDMLSLIPNCKKWGWQVTIITVLNTGGSVIQSLAPMMDYCGNQVNYVAVKSLFWQYSDDGFVRWDHSDEKKQFQKLGGKEIDMPILPPTTFDALHEQHASFLDLSKAEMGDQILAESFLRRGLFQINRIAPVFGLPVEDKGKG